MDLKLHVPIVRSADFVVWRVADWWVGVTGAWKTHRWVGVGVPVLSAACFGLNAV